MNNQEKNELRKNWLSFMDGYWKVNVSRRHFLKTSVQLAAGSTVLGTAISGLMMNGCSSDEDNPWSHLPQSLVKFDTSPTIHHEIMAERLSSVALLGPPNSSDLLNLATHLYTKEAAEILSQFPSKIFATLDELVQVTGKSEEEIRTILNPVVNERIVVLELDRIVGGMKGYEWVDSLVPMVTDLLDTFGKLIAPILNITIPENPQDLLEKTFYLISPIIPPMYEANFMNGVVSPWHKRYAELFFKVYNTGYWTEYVKDHGDLTLLRTIPVEQSLSGIQLSVLNSDRFSDLLDSLEDITLMTCQCATSHSMINEPCQMTSKHLPNRPCIIAGPIAKTLIEMGWAQPATKEEVMAIREETMKDGAIHITFNVQNSDCFYICACCSCCCQLLKVLKDFDCPNAMAQPHLIPELHVENCLYCHDCEEICQMDAHSFADNLHTHNIQRCIGCGQCIRVCPKSNSSEENKALCWKENPLFNAPKPMTDFIFDFAGKFIPIAVAVMSARGDKALIK